MRFKCRIVAPMMPPEYKATAGVLVEARGFRSAAVTHVRLDGPRILLLDDQAVLVEVRAIYSGNCRYIRVPIKVG